MVNYVDESREASEPTVSTLSYEPKLRFDLQSNQLLPASESRHLKDWIQPRHLSLTNHYRLVRIQKHV